MGEEVVDRCVLWAGAFVEGGGERKSGGGIGVVWCGLMGREVGSRRDVIGRMGWMDGNGHITVINQS